MIDIFNWFKKNVIKDYEKIKSEIPKVRQEIVKIESIVKKDAELIFNKAQKIEVTAREFLEKVVEETKKISNDLRLAWQVIQSHKKGLIKIKEDIQAIIESFKTLEDQEVKGAKDTKDYLISLLKDIEIAIEKNGIQEKHIEKKENTLARKLKNKL